MKHLNVIEDVLIASGITISLIDIQTILGIIILSVQVGLILFKGGKRIYDAIKNKNSKEIETAIEETKDQLESLSDKTKDGK